MVIRGQELRSEGGSGPIGRLEIGMNPESRAGTTPGPGDELMAAGPELDANGGWMLNGKLNRESKHLVHRGGYERSSYLNRATNGWG